MPVETNASGVVAQILQQPFNDAIDRVDGGRKIDKTWVRICANDKWPLFGNHIDWTGKTVLDIGCQCGYSAFQACAYGAREAIGWDVRPSALAVADAMRAEYPDADVVFDNRDWLKNIDAAPCSDVVLCMGLLHYFAGHDYERAFDGLFAAAREYVVIELMQTIQNGPWLVTRHDKHRTIATEAWLANRAGEMGFRVEARWAWADTETDVRALWVFQRIKIQQGQA